MKAALRIVPPRKPVAPVPVRPIPVPASAEEPKQGKNSQAVSKYRQYTEDLLRRYLYASMLVGRAPSLLAENVGRGWVSSHPVRSFEDAVVFVLDVERCLQSLSPLERQLISRVVLQEYSLAETATIMRACSRRIAERLNVALDALTQQFLDKRLLILPASSSNSSKAK